MTAQAKTPEKLLARPLRDRAELEQLDTWLAGRRAALRERGRIAAAVAAMLLVLAAVVVFTDPAVPGPDILILPALLLLAATIATPFIVRRFWAGPRLLAAQRRLLQDRGVEGVVLEDPEAMLADFVERIERAEALLAGDDASEAP